MSSTGLKWTSKSKSAQIGITKFSKPSWQPRNNHFVHYSDITLNSKDSINLLKATGGSATITHKELVDNLNEWKFHYILSQVNNLVSFFCYWFVLSMGQETRSFAD